MTKRTSTIITGFTSLALLAIILVAGYAQVQRMPQPAPTATQTDQTGSPAAAAPAGQAGAYVDYKDGLIASTAGTKVLFFHAPWCPQCRSLDTSIKAGPVPEGVTIMKIDYDSNQALRKEYGVTIQTTFVKVDDNGKFISKYVAYDEPNLAALTKQFLQ